MAISFNKNGETKEIATYQSCISNISVSDPNSWGNTYSATNGSLKLTVPSNGSSSRSETIVIAYKAGSNNCSKTVDITQEGNVTTTFKYCDDTTSKSLSRDANAYSETFCVVSTSGSSYLLFSPMNSNEWIHISTSNTGLTVSLDANTGAYRQGDFRLIQSDTGAILYFYVTQAASASGTFKYCDGTTAKTQNTDADVKNFRYCVESKIGGYAGQPYAVVGTLPNWITVATAGTYFNVALTQNTTAGERSYNMTLKQTNSNEQITLNIVQASSSCNEFLDSCCGKSSYSHPEYDIAIGYSATSYNADGIQYGSTCHVSNTLPSWLGVTYDTVNNVVEYTALETNTGIYREFTVEFELDTTTGTNVCQYASVLVRQDANPDQLMPINLNIINNGSSTADVASIKLIFANGYLNYKRINEYIAAGATYSTTDNILKTLNSQELYIGHPVDVILDDGTVKTGTINNLLIESGGTYTITFS